MPEQEPVFTQPDTPPVVEAHSNDVQQEAAAQPQLITPESMPGYVAPETPVATEPRIDYSVENAAKIARHNMVQNQAMLTRMTPPAPGTPVNIVERPPQA